MFSLVAYKASVSVANTCPSNAASNLLQTSEMIMADD